MGTQEGTDQKWSGLRLQFIANTLQEVQLSTSLNCGVKKWRPIWVAILNYIGMTIKLGQNDPDSLLCPML